MYKNDYSLNFATDANFSGDVTSGTPLRRNNLVFMAQEYVIVKKE